MGDGQSVGLGPSVAPMIAHLADMDLQQITFAAMVMVVVVQIVRLVRAAR